MIFTIQQLDGLSAAGEPIRITVANSVAEGAQGATGPAGPTGATGATGPQGATGPAGADGADGAPGAPGADGADGASAYEVAVANGFVGTEAEWLTSLVGDTGPQGPAGADGADGATGPQGPAGADGADGAPGADGADGVGVPVGGTAGQVLAKASGTDYDTEWTDQTGGGASTDPHPFIFGV